MSVDLKDLETTPTLSLDPFGEAEKEPEVPAAPAPEAVKPAFDESILNDDERKMVDSFAKQIDLTNNNMILQYGAGAQKKMADFRGGSGKRPDEGSRRGGRYAFQRGDGAQKL